MNDLRMGAVQVIAKGIDASDLRIKLQADCPECDGKRPAGNRPCPRCFDTGTVEATIPLAPLLGEINALWARIDRLEAAVGLHAKDDPG